MAALLYKWLTVSILSFAGIVPQATFSKPHTATNVAHPFYVSVVEVNHNSKDKTLEISCKLFADDMEDVLKQDYKTMVDLDVEKQHPLADKLITDYITRNLAVTIDGRPQKLTYVGFEKQSESVYCYFEIPNIGSVKNVALTNSLLLDFNDQQINIMHVTVKGVRKSYKLNYPEKQASFAF